MRITASLFTALTATAAASAISAQSLTTTGTEQASLEADAQAIVALWQAQPTDSDFDRWVSDQLLYYAAHCAIQAKMSLPAVIRAARPLGQGSWASPQNANQDRAVCRALASAKETGLAPVCASMTSTQPPFAFPPTGMPANYAYPGKKVEDGTKVTAGGYCLLVDGVSATRQFYAGPAVVRLLGQPAESIVQTAQGPRKLRVSSIRFEVQGGPASMPAVLAVWP